jgi:DNA-binding NarL/FixJ family response regulator
MKRARVILADDHTMVLEALKRIVEESEFDVVGTFTDGKTLIDAAPRLDPDVIVLDIGMPRMNGLIAGEMLRKSCPRAKLIYMTMNRYSDLAVEAFQLGASGYLLKTSALSELVYAIREALLGRSYITPQLADIRDDGSTARQLRQQRVRPKLTMRQKEILQLLAEGRTMKEIAFLLNLSPRTIAFHKYKMMTQLELKSSAALVQFAMKQSVVSG